MGGRSVQTNRFLDALYRVVVHGHGQGRISAKDEARFLQRASYLQYKVIKGDITLSALGLRRAGDWLVAVAMSHVAPHMNVSCVGIDILPT